MNNPDCWACGYCNSRMSLYIISNLVALISASSLLLAATWLGMPISATQTVVAATAGSALVFVGGSCLQWGLDGLGGILVAWLVSPLFAGLCAVVVHALLRVLIIRRRRPVRAALIALPSCAALSSTISVLVVARKMLNKSDVVRQCSFFDFTPLLMTTQWIAVVIACAGGVLVFLVVRCGHRHVCVPPSAHRPPSLIGIPLLRRALRAKAAEHAAVLETVEELSEEASSAMVERSAHSPSTQPPPAEAFDFGAIPTPVCVCAWH